MPKNLIHANVTDWQEIHALPGSWPDDRLREVLELAEYDEPVADEDLLDMTLMALQDLGARDASDVVLRVVFGDAMGSGVRQNFIDDLEDDRPWEQFATVNMQAGVFETVVLLQQAFPTRFGIPDGGRLTLTVTATDKETQQWFDADPLPALLLRVLASAMPEDAVLKRLYESELTSTQFPDAQAILWYLQEVSTSRSTPLTARSYEICSSWQWLGALQECDEWSAAGWPDEALMC